MNETYLKLTDMHLLKKAIFTFKFCTDKLFLSLQDLVFQFRAAL